MSGGAGRDLVTYASRGTRIFVSLDGQPNDGGFGEGDNVMPSTEAVVGGRGRDTLVGNDRPNVLVGGAGADRILGLGGGDLIVGGQGKDSIDAGAGSDRVAVRDGTTDQVRCGDGGDAADADKRRPVAGLRVQAGGEGDGAVRGALLALALLALLAAPAGAATIDTTGLLSRAAGGGMPNGPVARPGLLAGPPDRVARGLRLRRLRPRRRRRQRQRHRHLRGAPRQRGLGRAARPALGDERPPARHARGWRGAGERALDPAQRRRRPGSRRAQRAPAAALRGLRLGRVQPRHRRHQQPARRVRDRPELGRHDARVRRRAGPAGQRRDLRRPGRRRLQAGRLHLRRVEPRADQAHVAARGRAAGVEAGRDQRRPTRASSRSTCGCCGRPRTATPSTKDEALAGATFLASANDKHVPANGPSYDVSLTQSDGCPVECKGPGGAAIASGVGVAFTSEAANLSAADTNGVADVYRRLFIAGRAKAGEAAEEGAADAVGTAGDHRQPGLGHAGRRGGRRPVGRAVDRRPRPLRRVHHGRRQRPPLPGAAGRAGVRHQRDLATWSGATTAGASRGRCGRRRRARSANRATGRRRTRRSRATARSSSSPTRRTCSRGRSATRGLEDRNGTGDVFYWSEQFKNVTLYSQDSGNDVHGNPVSASATRPGVVDGAGAEPGDVGLQQLRGLRERRPAARPVGGRGDVRVGPRRGGAGGGVEPGVASGVFAVRGAAVGGVVANCANKGGAPAGCSTLTVVYALKVEHPLEFRIAALARTAARGRHAAPNCARSAAGQREVKRRSSHRPPPPTAPRRLRRRAPQPHRCRPLHGRRSRDRERRGAEPPQRRPALRPAALQPHQRNLGRRQHDPPRQDRGGTSGSTRSGTSTPPPATGSRLTTPAPDASSTSATSSPRASTRAPCTRPRSSASSRSTRCTPRSPRRPAAAPPPACTPSSPTAPPPRAASSRTRCSRCSSATACRGRRSTPASAPTRSTSGFPERALVVELDGWRYHGTRVRHRLDADKQARLEAAGLRVLRADWEQVTGDGAQTADRLRQALD